MFFSFFFVLDLEKFLLKVGVLIVNVLLKIYLNFKEVIVIVKIVSFDIVMVFFIKVMCYIDVFFCLLDNIIFRYISCFKLLMEYCMMDENFL